MSSFLSSLRWLIPAIFLLSILVVHFRGRVRHKLWKQIFDTSGVLAPINAVIYALSAVPAKPYISTKLFPELEVLRDNIGILRDEGLALRESSQLRRPDRNDDAGFNSFAKSGWSRFYVKWYDSAHPSAERFCPRTAALLRQIPSIKAAMFVDLPPGAVLKPHRDPYAGSLRYHLGIVTPNDDRCNIIVDGEPYSWRDNEAVIFDESFIHEAHNGTDQHRLILFCDIERPLHGRLARAFNHWFGRNVMSAAASPNEVGDRVGIINKLFLVSVVVGRWRRRFKAWNKTVYQVTKVALVVAFVAWIVFG